MTSTKKFVEFDKSTHDRQSFDCGTNELNSFLRSKADEHRKQKISRTMVLLADSPAADQRWPILAYYTTAFTTLEKTDIPSDLTKRLPPYPVPVYIITCLAVAIECQNQGLGKITIIRALESLHKISKEMPAFAVVIDPIDERAESLYKQYNFQNLDDENASKRLFLPMRTVDSLFDET